MRDNIQELVKEAGTRPAGSKQEFHAAEVIATRFGGFGLDATIEEFATDRFAPMMHLATLGLVAVGSLICFLTPKLAIVSLILVILGILLFLLELLDLNPLHRLLPTGLSQNVIARYNPHQFDGGSTSGGTASSGKPQRKIVVVARYDSPRTRIEAMSFLATRLRLLKTAQAALLGIAILPAILLLLPAPGIVQTIASWAALVCFGLLFVNFLVKLIDQFLPHQVGANVNLSGVGVLFGLADILGELLSNDEQRKGQTNVHRLRARREYRNQLAAAAGATNVSDKVEAAMVDGAEIESDGVQAATDSRSRSDAVGQEPASLTQGIPLQNNVDSDGALSGPMPMLHDASAASGPDVGDEMLRKNYGNGEDPRMRSDITGRIGNRVPGGSIAGNLVQVGSERASIFVTPRSESQENKQAEEFERDQSDLGQLDPVEVEEEPPAIDDEGGDEEDANLPEWYRKAKKAAEQKSERKIQDEEGGEVVRSRFADIPTPAHESGDGVNSPLIPAHQSENDTSLPPMANRRSSDAEISKIFQLQSETPMEPMPNELNFQDSILGFEPEVEADTLEASSDRPEITRSDNISDVSKASLATGIPSADAVPSADTAMHSAAAGEAGISAAPAFQQTAAVERPAVSPVSPSVPAPAALGSQLAQPALDDTRDRAVRKDQLGQNLQSDQQNQDLSFNRGDIRSKPDFSGLDKQAFRVVPDTNSATGALIVPTHDTDLSQEASRAGSQPKRRVERRRQERQAAVQPEQDTERQPAREQESNSSSQSNRQLDIQPEIQPENSDAGDKELQPEHDAKRSRLLNLPEVIESKAEQLTITQAGMEIVDVDADDLFASEES
ncbi:MAG: hypothetical protein LBH87_03680, partial [Coriobacteriales bacterium]|nr:hypothetical protein [Coriobacteriales bacterium]